MTTSSYESLGHSKWDCKYHIVFVPKNRRKVLYGKVRKYLGPVFHQLAGQRECKILKGSMVQDRVHMLIQFYQIGTAVKFIMNVGNHKFDGMSSYPFKAFRGLWDSIQTTGQIKERQLLEIK